MRTSATRTSSKNRIRFFPFLVIGIITGGATYFVYGQIMTPSLNEAAFEKGFMANREKAGNASSAGEDCQLDRVATLPLLANGRPLIEASINGKTVRMVVDTGAQGVSVTPEIVTTLGLAQDSDRHTIIHTVGGQTTAQNVLLDKLDIATLDRINQRAAVIAIDGGELGTPAGIIGTNVIFDYEIELDIPKHVLTLYRAHGCSPRRPPWEGYYQTVSMSDSNPGQFRFPVELNGHLATALFDTGSRGETVSRAFAKRIGISDSQLENDPSSNGTSAGKLGYTIRRHRFESFHIGEETFHNIPLDVADFQQPGTDMMVGADYMHGRRFFLSYSAGLLFIQRASNEAIRQNLASQSQANRETDPCRPSPEVLRTLARKPPIAISRPQLDMSAKARADHIQGCAAVMFHLAPDGTPFEIKLVKESPLGYGFGKLLTQGVSETRFQPTTESGWYYEVRRFHAPL